MCWIIMWYLLLMMQSSLLFNAGLVCVLCVFKCVCCVDKALYLT